MKHAVALLAFLLVAGGCARPTPPPISTNPNVVFDIPPLLDKDLALATSQLGEPVSTKTVIVPDADGLSAVWKKADGSSLVVAYDIVGKKMWALTFTVPFKVATSDKGKILRDGNLRMNDPRYSVRFIYSKGTPSKVVGATIKSLPVK